MKKRTILLTLALAVERSERVNIESTSCISMQSADPVTAAWHFTVTE